MTAHTGGPEVRTGEILEALRRELRVLGRPADVPTAGAGESGQASQGVRQLVRELEERWVVRPRPFTSRVPVVGPVIARFRSLWNEVSTRWYVQPLFEQQMEFNAAVLRLARLTANVLDALEGEARAGWAGQAPYDREQVALARSVAELDVLLRRMEESSRARDDGEVLAELRGRVSRLESAVAGDKPPRYGEAPPGLREPQATAPGQTTALAAPMDYVGFEERFRGSSAEVRERQRPYVEYFRGEGTVVDLGCGRGEFLSLLVDAGVPGKGVDGDAGMAAAGTERGLDVVEGDLMEFLAGQEDGSLGGVFSAQVVEHLPADAVRALVYLSYQKLRAGGVFIAETVNPRSLLALSHNYTLDLSHRQPVHPETLAFLAESYGFGAVEVRYCSPAPELARLQHLPSVEGLEEWQGVLNEDIQQLNEFLYGYQDYAVIARKPGG